MGELLSTALENEHVAAGATMTDFAGWNMPLRFSSDRAEHEAVRTLVGKFDLSHMGQVEVEGPQAAQVLEYALCIRCSKMTLGRARYAMILNKEGGIIDDLIVYRLGEERFLVVPNGANRLRVLDELTARGRAWCKLHNVEEEHSITDRTLQRALIAVQGPKALETVTALMKEDDAATLKELGYYRAIESHVLGMPCVIARTGYTGEVGYELMVPSSGAVEIWRALDDVLPCGLASRDSLRLEAGMPLYGHELNEEVSPVDTGAASLVGPHEFVGSEALSSREAKYALYGLAGEGRRAARAGSKIFVGDKEVGSITSGILSPTLGYPVALALLEPGLEVGTPVYADVRGTLQAMNIVELPFYSRTRK